MVQDYSQIEQRLGQAMYMNSPERALSDKALATKEIEAIKEIVKRDTLGLADLRELSYLLSAAETKLVELDHRERWLLGKYLTWINQITQIQETNIKNMKVHKSTKISDFEISSNISLTDTMIFEILDEEIKKMVNIYLYLTRSSLSLDGVGFSSLLSQKFEYEYKGTQPHVQQPAGQTKQN